MGLHRDAAGVAVESSSIIPTLAQTKEFADFRKQVEILKGLLSERRYTAEALQNMSPTSRRWATSSLRLSGAPVQTSTAEEQPAEATSAPPGGTDSTGSGQGVAQMDLPNELASTAGPGRGRHDRRHGQGVGGEAHGSPSRRPRTLSLPPEAQVSGRDGGRRRWPRARRRLRAIQVRGLSRAAAAVVRRMDYVYGDYEIEFFVDGKNAGSARARAPTACIAGATGRT